MLSAAYHRDFGVPVRYEFDWLPEDGDGQVRSSIRRMIEYILGDTCFVELHERALAAASLSPGDPIRGVWQTVKPLIHFKQDRDIAYALDIDDPRIADTVEVFIRPIDQELLIRLRGSGVEDCDGFALYAACLLTILGVKCSLVTISADPKRPDQFSHVYLAAYQNGVRIPLDFSHGPYPGWENPHLGRIREWPIAEDFFCSGVKWIALALISAVVIASAKRRAA